MPSAILSVIASFVVCYVLLRYLLARKHLLPLDLPNERSLHTAPIPRIGGVGICAGLAAALTISWPASLSALLIPATGLMLVSMLDDQHGLSVPVRLAAHLIATATFLALIHLFNLPFFLAALLSLVWMTNLYNFMDGADGLAGGMAIFGFGCYGFLAWLAGDSDLARLAVSILAATFAFLSFNLPPSRLFMGDTGSITLGFLAGTISIIGCQRGLWPWVTPVIVFSPFIVDASVTLVRRAIRCEKIWRAHHNHYYQRLVRMGWSHRRLAASEYTLMFATAISGALVAIYPQMQWPLLVSWGLVYGLIMALIDKHWRQFKHAA